ncbi:NAD(P)-binding protein [Sistotremastrum niveocremeum HHB9708]|uniref:NAD(P)-binding protein n=1 Tax=Sistotremastrum niveocremeum HHB9708 TaxID=1314777 RepID=A0A164N7H1_9AGAM|nr:NAD(P)-binding protein [Sistotremastrum niveocremeum HHB9708]
MPIPPEDLPVKIHHDIYPGIDPTPHFEQKTYTGKTVLIAGASRGIGACIARFYARAGANLALMARSEASLSTVKEDILKLVPDARVGVFEGDVCDVGDVERVVREVVGDGTDAGLGRRLDIVVACAGKVDLYDRPFTQDDPEKWWKTIEVNLRGVYNIAHFTLPHLDKTEGYFIITSSTAAQCRIPLISPYAISKHAVGRLNEYIPIGSSSSSSPPPPLSPFSSTD